MWFDESGKTQEPVFLLAGYAGKFEMWKAFAVDWQTELDREPKLPYLHANERQIFRGLSDDERVARILRFVAVIRKHQPRGIIFVVKHSDYGHFYRIICAHPTITRAEQRMMKNPYYFSFTYIFMQMLIRQARHCGESGVEEMLELLFDDGLERKPRLKIGFEHFINTAREKNPEALRLLVNCAAEFRDDKRFPPLQACDLLAWHFRRFCETGQSYRDPIWTALRQGIEYEVYPFKEEQWIKLLLRLRQSTWQELQKLRPVKVSQRALSAYVT